MLSQSELSREGGERTSSNYNLVVVELITGQGFSLTTWASPAARCVGGRVRALVRRSLAWAFKHLSEGPHLRAKCTHIRVGAAVLRTEEPRRKKAGERAEKTNPSTHQNHRD